MLRTSFEQKFVNQQKMKKLCIISLNDVNNVPGVRPGLDITTGSNSDHDLSDTDTIDSNENQGMCQKRKRQRLTHLTPEEKLMRRKLKNRVAAQSARDRKKVKMDDLEITCDQLQTENNRLKKENALLKEKAQLLINENRKLLKFKSDTEQNQKFEKTEDAIAIIRQPTVLNNSNLTIGSSDRELTSMKAFFEADESAVFTKYASQPKRQLQGMFQRMIYMLILQTLSLLRTELVNSHGRPRSKSKVLKLKSALEKLYKLASSKGILPKPQDSIQIMNTYRKSPMSTGSLNLLMLVSVMRAMKLKKHRL